MGGEGGSFKREMDTDAQIRRHQPEQGGAHFKSSMPAFSPVQPFTSMHSNTLKVLGVTLLAALSGPVYAAVSWPQFRGPKAGGIGAHGALPDRGSATENVASKTDLPGRSWSSPIVSDGRVFLTAVVNSGDSEAPRPGGGVGGMILSRHDSIRETSPLWLSDLLTTMNRGRPVAAWGHAAYSV